MPSMDKTGPRGESSMTGRGLGKCGGEVSADPGRSRGLRGRFLRRGRGLGLRQRARDTEDRA